MTTNTTLSHAKIIKGILAKLKEHIGPYGEKLTDETLNLIGDFSNQVSQGKLCLKEALNIPKTRMDMFYTMAYELYQRNKYEKAEKLFSLLTFCDPLEEKYWEGLGATEKQLKNFDLAAAAYGMLTQIKPKQALYYLNLAECLFNKKQLKEAMQCCEAMIFLSETFPEDNPNITIHVQKAKLLMQTFTKKLEE